MQKYLQMIIYNTAIYSKINFSKITKASKLYAKLFLLIKLY